MAKNQLDKGQKDRPISQLERFQLAFEYDKTIQEIRREVRARSR